LIYLNIIVNPVSW